MPMPAILQGSLAHFRVDELLTLLSANKHTGTLEASENKQHARIVFRDGVVVHAEATRAPDPREAVLAPFTWPAGSFTFVEDANVSANAKRPDLDLNAVIDEGKQRATEWKEFAAAYPDENVKLRVLDNPAVQGSITLSPDEFRMLVRIGGGQSLGRLCDDLQSPIFEVYRTVHRLEKAGLLKRVDKPAPIETTAVLDQPMIREAAQQAQPLTTAPVPVQQQSTPQGPLVGTLTAPTGSMFPLVDTEVIIGRDASCAISINDSSVSPTHAKITRGPQGFSVEDLGSRNGTFVNSDRITQRRLLINQDVVRVGKVVLTFNLAAQAAQPKASQQKR